MNNHQHPAEESPGASSKVDSPSLRNWIEPWLVHCWLEATNVRTSRTCVISQASILDHCANQKSIFLWGLRGCSNSRQTKTTLSGRSSSISSRAHFSSRCTFLKLAGCSERPLILHRGDFAYSTSSQGDLRELII